MVFGAIVEVTAQKGSVEPFDSACDSFAFLERIPKAMDQQLLRHLKLSDSKFQVLGNVHALMSASTERKLNKYEPPPALTATGRCWHTSWLIYILFHRQIPFA